VRITVSDTGVGIPAAKIQTVFEPFVQLDRSLTHVRDGSGLGLAISRDLARRMGGDIQVDSTVGQGSVFTLILPGAPAQPSTSADRRRTPKQSQDAEQAG
jgi:signal transduction histidine kinase